MMSMDGHCGVKNMSLHLIAGVAIVEILGELLVLTNDHGAQACPHEKIELEQGYPTEAQEQQNKSKLSHQVSDWSGCRLTPELSRTAARNGGVVHVTMQPSREAVSA